MLGRLGGAFVAALLLVAALLVMAAPAPEAQAARMCPPVTLDDLFPEPAKPTPTPSPTPTTVPDTGTSTTTTTSTVPVSSTNEPPVTTAPGEGSTVTTEPGAGSTTAPPRPAPKCVPFRYDMRWPLAGRGQILSGFGADRDGGDRHHKGNDISAPKLTPVVAVADAVVIKVTQQVGTEECCWVSLRHDDGWQSYYIHLNNDRWATDDGMGFGVRTDLVEGMEVAEGEVIGWVGDSGNAEETVDHLHFELRTPAGVAVDPRASLQAAQRRAEIADPQPTWPYADDDGHEIEGLAATLLAEGLFMPCDDTMVNLCPDEVATPDLAAGIVRALTGKTPPPLEGRFQPLPAALDPSLVVPRTLEGAFGCAPIEQCLDFGLPETELARLAVWVRLDDLVIATLAKEEMSPEWAPVVHLPTSADAEARLREYGLRGECNPPLDDANLLTREETVSFLVSWLRGVNPQPCTDPAQRIR